MPTIHGIAEAMWFENSNFDLFDPNSGGGAGTGENDFEAPDWPTNSTFTVDVPMTVTPGGAGPGLDTATSTISNTAVRIRQDFEMIDTTTGVDQGSEPAVTGAVPESIISNRYIMKQSFKITNISDVTLTDVELFQFLHGLHSEIGVYDDRTYPLAAFKTYVYDITLHGIDTLNPDFEHDDVDAFHSVVRPTAWEVGNYDRNGPFDATGKPSAEIHIDVEGNALDSATDFFTAPQDPEGIASGAQRFSLGALGPEQMATFDVLLSISTETVPEPSTLLLGALALACLGLVRHRRGN